MCVPFLSFLFFRLEDLDRDHWNIYIFFFFKKIFILLVERKPHVRCTEIKKKSYIFHSDEYYSFWVKKETVLRRLEG